MALLDYRFHERVRLAWIGVDEEAGAISQIFDLLEAQS